MSRVVLFFSDSACSYNLPKMERVSIVGRLTDSTGLSAVDVTAEAPLVQTTVSVLRRSVALARVY